MFAQQSYRPEIARVAEETVLNLKQLESRIEVLKNDLAALCTVVGHPEAARIAVTPTSWLGVTAPHLTQGGLGLGNLGNLGISPYGQVPFQGIGQGIGQPFGHQGFGTPFGSSLGISPLVSPWTQGISPFQGISPYAGVGQGFGFPGFR